MVKKTFTKSCSGVDYFLTDFSHRPRENPGSRRKNYSIFLLTGLDIYTGEYKAQGPTLCPTEGRALRGPRALDSPV